MSEKTKMIADITRLFAVLEEIHEEKNRLLEKTDVFLFELTDAEKAQLKLLTHLEKIYTGVED